MRPNSSIIKQYYLTILVTYELAIVKYLRYFGVVLLKNS